MRNLDYSQNVLESGVWRGPAQIVLQDKTDVESLLREEPTTGSRKTWAEKPYDFPNSYITMPVKVLDRNPISTYAEDQNNRFKQRYPLK